MSKEKSDNIPKAQVVNITLRDVYDIVMQMKEEISELRTDVDKLIENGGK